MILFDKNKEEALNKLDKSRKGSIDKEIAHIINFVNQQNNFYTTSSCAGRISALEWDDSVKKQEANWLYVAHGKADPKELKQSLKTKKEVWLKQEPAIFHIIARTLDDAKRILDAARNAGMKRTGITTLGEKRGD